MTSNGGGLQIQFDASGGAHTAMPMLLSSLWAEHKIIALHAAYALQQLTMADNNSSLMCTVMPDLLEKLVVLLHQVHPFCAFDLDRLD
jgi:hypothetical protein